MTQMLDDLTASIPRGRRGRRSSLRLVLATLTVALALPTIAAPIVNAGSTILVNTVNQEINGDGLCSLQEAIYAANLDDNIAPDVANPGQFFDTACPGGSGHDVIELPPMGVFTFADPISEYSNFMGPTATPMIVSDITIEGRGARLERLAAGRATRLFAVAPAGYLDLREVHVKGFAIRGGNGGNGGGGGGMGAGGAIYVQGGRLLVQWSTFEGNAVRGGDGGNENPGDGGGGGGGLSGNGGTGGHSAGGGGGARGDGGNGRDSGGDHWGGGGGGTVTSGAHEVPGESCGGAGGESFFGEGGDGYMAECAGGGGGGGSGSDDILNGHGALGLYGGGGGGGGAGAGISSGDAGDGGFGGGGGGSPDNQGGHGGFGGGGGSGFEAFSEGRGQGGTFAGDGDRAGGGGAGLGGAIFGYLADIDVSNSTFHANGAERGKSGIACGLDSCGAGANDGRGAGGAIFTVGGDLSVVNSTLSGNETITVTRGGGGAIVVYDPEGTDEASLLLRNNIIAGNGSSECYTRNGVDTGGSSGNITTNSELNNLNNPACPGVVSATDPGLGALGLNAPGRTPTMAIGPTSSAIDAAVGTVGVNIPLDDQRGIARPQGNVADIGAYEYEAPASVPPVTTVALTPATPNGSNDWYTSSVAVSITATDVDDAVSQTRCVLDPVAAVGSFADLPDASCALTGVTADGHHAILAASRDAAGNMESPLVSATLKIDATDPVLAPSLNVASVAIGQTGVVASPNASDATSGVASASCGAVDTSTPGAKTVTCTATDTAGNTASADLAYVVEYRILGFFSPVPGSKWKVKSTVPVKIGLGDGSGVRIGDAEASGLAQSCRVTFSATGAQPKPSQCMKYDLANDQFIHNWKLGKNGTGPAEIVVTVSYPGSNVTTRLTASITITP